MLLAHRLSIVGITFLACAVIGVATLIFDVVAGSRVAGAAAGLVVVLLVTLWLAMPLGLRRHDPR